MLRLGHVRREHVPGNGSREEPNVPEKANGDQFSTEDPTTRYPSPGSGEKNVEHTPAAARSRPG
jgi:hypothetical protein